MLRLLPRDGRLDCARPDGSLPAREKTRQNDGGDSDGGIYFTPRSGRCDSAASENDGAVRPVQFLNDEGRCSIHDARPGFCRMFPLGRLYENGTFSYFLQVSECPKENKTKVKVRRWLDTPELGKYEAFTNEWHYYLKEKQNEARRTEDDALRQQISMGILKLFYLLPYDTKTDFYAQFAARMEAAGKN